jgi:ferredoxin-type protein NapH
MVAMAKDKSGIGQSRLARRRFWVQAVFAAVWMDFFVLNLLRLHSFCSPVFHCYSCPLASFACPIGVIANFSALHMIPFIALGTLLAVGAVAGTLVCGWACPFGFLQDVAAKLPLPKVELPSWTGYTRYAVLVGLVVVVPYQYGERHPLFFCSVCPAGALEAALPNLASAARRRWLPSSGDSPSQPDADASENASPIHAAGSSAADDSPTEARNSPGESAPLPWLSEAKTIILLAFVAAIFFAWRPWCTAFCPLGAIFSLCNRFSFLYLRFRPASCVNCAVCRSVCQHGGSAKERIGDLTCVRCLECSRCRAVTLQTGLSRVSEGLPRRPAAPAPVEGDPGE